MPLIRSFLKIIVFAISFNLQYINAESDDEFVVINDIEIEDFLQKIIIKIFAANGINYKPKIFIIQSDMANAFATHGGNIFVFTGLLKQFESAAEVFAVLAHEIGHVVEKHLELLEAHAKKQSLIALITLPILPISLPMIMEENFRYSRDKELSADNFAIATFHKLKYSLKAMKNVIRYFQNEKRLNFTEDVNKNFMPLLTHPADNERLANINAQIIKEEENNPILFDQELEEQFKIIKYKIKAYTENPDEFLSNYRENTTYEIGYGRAIAYARNFEIDKSMEIFDQITKNNKSINNIYLLNTKAELLFKNGRVKESECCYRELLQKIKDKNKRMMIKLLIAEALMASSDDKNTEDWDPNLILKLFDEEIDNNSEIYDNWKFNSDVMRKQMACFDKLGDAFMKKIYRLKLSFIDAIRSGNYDKEFFELLKREIIICQKEHLNKIKNKAKKIKVIIDDFVKTIDDLIGKI